MNSPLKRNYLKRNDQRILSALAVAVVLISSLSLAQANAANADKHTSIYKRGEYSFSVEKTPAWIKRFQAPRVVNTKPSGQSSNYLLVDKQLKFGSTPEYFFHYAEQPLTSNGVEQSSQIEIEFNPSYQKLSIHQIHVQRGDKKIDKLVPSTIKLLQRERDIERMLYDGVVSAMIILDDIRAGDIIDYSYTLQGHNPAFGDKHFSTSVIAWNVPVSKTVNRYILPKGREIHYKQIGFDDKPSISHDKNNTIYTWVRDNVAAIIAEDNTPPWYYPYPSIQFSEYKDWQDVNNWANKLYTFDSVDLGEKLKKQIQQWKTKFSNKIDYARNALQFVQNDIRYFGVEFGQNSHLPSPPKEVFGKRFGDCKDKAVLLTAILKDNGISASPALVSTSLRRGIDRFIPSPAAFNHVIVYTKIDNHTYWLDATKTYQEGGLEKLGQPNFGKALIINGSYNKLSNIELSDRIPFIKVDEDFISTDFNGNVTLKIRSVYSGSAAEKRRAYFADTPRAEIQKKFTNYYERMFSDVSLIDDISTVDDANNNTFTVFEKYKIANFWQKTHKASEFSLYAYTIEPYTALPDTLKRKSPLGLAYPVHVQHNTSVHFPENVHYDTSNSDSEIDDEAFNYSLHVKYSGKTLVLSHDYRATRDSVSPEKIALHIRHLKDVNKRLSYSGYISDKKADPKFQSNTNFVKQFLKKLSSQN